MSIKNLLKSFKIFKKLIINFSDTILRIKTKMYVNFDIYVTLYNINNNHNNIMIKQK